ncbi:uncharacterized protein LOC128264407 [Drosophila gunungcola]|uniref:Uncharacterized protein n=1 Tax=Drosophila gunungcola TaxID=103775 RepID=A0A9P9YCR2_9MUSC|nr:uncharacterized protein LOC108137237 [Drosophila elegans]XP_052855812.1 uncharacterized protein LOC128264407 [Drosophila gunungcola]KAI8034531.1 hypothetical protein M5D96_012718 [Drosophila gunungcola]
MKFFIVSLLIAACVALAQSSVIHGSALGYAPVSTIPVVRTVPVVRSVPVVRHVPVVRNVPVVRHVPIVDSVQVVQPSVYRVGHAAVYDAPLIQSYGGWLKQK